MVRKKCKKQVKSQCFASLVNDQYVEIEVACSSVNCNIWSKINVKADDIKVVQSGKFCCGVCAARNCKWNTIIEKNYKIILKWCQSLRRS